MNLAKKEPESAEYERSDVCAVSAASVIVENVIAFEVARALCEKFGHDSLTVASLQLQPIDLVYVLGNELNTGRREEGGENRTSASELEARLFDIVGHLNAGRAGIEGVDERRRLADLNRRAGIKARDATAYDLAVSSFRTAIELDGAAAWRDRYGTEFDTHRRLAEALGLTADAAGALSLSLAPSPSLGASPSLASLDSAASSSLTSSASGPAFFACAAKLSGAR